MVANKLKKHTGAGAALSPPRFRVARSRATTLAKTTTQRATIRADQSGVAIPVDTLSTGHTSRRRLMPSPPSSSFVDSLDFSRVVFSFSFLPCAHLSL